MSQQKQKAPKVVVIGLDGAPYPLIQKWSQEGYLPNLSRLIERGSFGILNSTIPVHSPTAWASFLTGVNPGKHGVFDFVRREANSYQLRVMRADQIAGASLWHLLSEQGYRVGVVNVPMTYPPEPVNGFLVSGLGTPDYVPYTYPPELSDKLNEMGYQVNKKFFFDIKRQDEWLDDVFTSSDLRGKVAVHLLQTEPCDFFMVVFRNTDEICHFYWHHMDESHPRHDPLAPIRYKTAIRDLYKLVDHWVGQIVDAVDEDTSIIIMSDHGAGPLYQDVFLNEWLWQNGWLQLNQTTQKQSTVQKIAQHIGLTRKNISDTLTRLHLHRVEVGIKKLLGDKIYVLPRDERPEFMNAIDWTRTQAYSFGYYGQIYINLKGREPDGTIQSGEAYEHLRQAIAAKLKSLIDPRDGRSVVDKIYFKEDLYHGEQLEAAPDILAIMRDFTYMTRKGYEFAEKRGDLFRDPYTQETGSHRLEGICIAAGPHIEEGQLPPKDIQDLAPTILHLMGCAIPIYMDGKPIAELFSPTYQAQRPFQFNDTAFSAPREQNEVWDERMESEITERLQNLGYLR